MRLPTIYHFYLRANLSSELNIYIEAEAETGQRWQLKAGRKRASEREEEEEEEEEKVIEAPSPQVPTNRRDLDEERESRGS